MTRPVTPLLQHIGAHVRRARAAAGTSRAALAAQSGLSMRFLAGLESGTANISLLRLQQVAQALGLDLAALVAPASAERMGRRRNSGAGRTTRAPAKTSAAEAAHAEAAIAAVLAGRSAAELGEVRDWLAARFAAERGPLIALLGLRGAGKSSVGKHLARRLGVPFHELDALIERAAGLPLAQIFELQGEAFYRRLERETLARFLATTPAAVLATGGGVVTSPETFALLGRRCTTVWLQATPELHWRRVVRQGDRRPMRGHPGAMQELRALLAARGPLYAQAHLCIDTSGRSPAAVAEELASRLRTRRDPPQRSGGRRPTRPRSATRR
jgi:XRE family aerobic/anaerobic benzoate catabolism transcriptional regulator